MKKIIIAASILLAIVATKTFALPTEWGIINPGDISATDQEMLAVMDTYWSTDGTGPAYFIWTNDSNRINWNIAWTGGYGSTTDTFSGTIALQSASTNYFEEVSFDTGSDFITDQESSFATFTAKAWNYYDGISFEITDYTLPSYVGFDLIYNDKSSDGLESQDGSNIFFGSEMISAMSLGGDQDFAVAAPVPEPATMILLGTGLLGFAGARRKKKK